MSWFRRGHRHPEEELSAYLDGHLDEAARSGVEAHLDACEACRALLADLRATKAALAALPRIEPRRSFALTPEHARPAAVPARRHVALSFAPAVALTVFVALLAVDISGALSGQDSRGLPPALTGKADQAQRETLRMPQASAPQDAAGSQAETAPSPFAAPQAAAPAPSPPVAPSEAERPAGRSGDGVHVLGAEENSDETVLRVLEVLAAVAFAGSLALAFWSRRKQAGASGRRWFARRNGGS